MKIKKKINDYFKQENIKAIKDYPKDKETVLKWEAFLDNLSKSKNPYIMSLNKYKCRMELFSNKYIIFKNFYSMFELISMSFKSFFNKLKNDNIQDDKKESVDMVIQIRKDLGIHDIFPEKLYNEFPNYKEEMADFTRIDIKHKGLIKAYRKLRIKNFFRFQYRVMARREFALHSYILEKYNPKMVAVYINERNVFSSILKSVYEEEDREIANIMHGTNLFSVQNSFMSFSRMYIWDKGYKDMFQNRMYCDVGKYIVYRPDKLTYKFEIKDEYEKDLTYFLSGQDADSQKKLFEITKLLRAKNLRLMVRPHPRVKLIDGIYPEDEEIFNEYIETNVDLKTSLEESEYIVGMNSTVIEEAYYADKKILIDDVTSKEEYESLRSRGYLMIDKIYDEQETNISFFSDYLKALGIEY